MDYEVQRLTNNIKNLENIIQGLNEFINSNNHLVCETYKFNKLRSSYKKRLVEFKQELSKYS